MVIFKRKTKQLTLKSECDDFIRFIGTIRHILRTAKKTFSTFQ